MYMKKMMPPVRSAFKNAYMRIGGGSGDANQHNPLLLETSENVLIILSSNNVPNIQLCVV